MTPAGNRGGPGAKVGIWVWAKVKAKAEAGAAQAHRTRGLAVGAVYSTSCRHGPTRSRSLKIH